MEVTAGHDDDPLPDLYKLPPQDITNYDDWRQDRVSGDEDPAPDYSSCDSDSDSADDAGRETGLKESIGPRLNVLLSSDGYDDVHHGSSADEGYDGERTESDEARRRHASDGCSGLISPKKLANPCKESREHQDLHREMLMNKKMGVDVLDQKSELTKELNRRRATMKKKECEEADRKCRTSFEIKLEEQANKLKLVDKEKEKDSIAEESREQNEFLKVHSKIAARSRCASDNS